MPLLFSVTWISLQVSWIITNSEIIRHKPVFLSGSKRSANVCALRNRDIPRVNYEERTAVPGLLRSDNEPTKFYF